MSKRINRRFNPLVLAAAAGAALASASAAKAQSSWAAVLSDSWFNGARWSPTGVPNSASTNVTLGLAGAYTVSMQNNSATCGTLTLSNAAAVLSLYDNTALSVAGATISNSGLISISDPAAPGNQARLLVANAATSISGSGTLRLQATTSNGDSDTAYLYYSAPANVLTNGSTHSIKGYGHVYTNLVNNGTVNADIAAKGIFMIEQPKANNGTMTASNSGFLQVRSTSLTQGASGVCLSSNNSVIQFNSASISGGTLNGAGTGGGVQYYGSCTADGVTLQNLNAVTDNSFVTVTGGGAVNNGTWTVSDPAAPGNQSRILAGAPAVSIGGTGTIRLQATTSNGDSDTAYLYYTLAANVLTNGPTHAIKGYGRVYTNLVNNGTVNADIANKGLFIIDQPKINNGTMSASNGAFLQIRSVTVNQGAAGQIVSTDAASPVQVVSAAVSGGVLTTPGAGVFQYYGSSTLSNLTVTGTHQITDNSNVNLPTNLVNNGVWKISDPAAPGNQTNLTATAPVTISGTGSIRLQATTSNGDSNTSYLNYNVPASILTLGSGQTVFGYGRVFPNVVNNGTMNADISGKGLFFIDQPKTNNATIEATNGGFIYIRGITMTQASGGLISTLGASTFGLESSTVSGGTISTSAAGPMSTAGSDTLSGVTLGSGSVMQISDNSNVNLTASGLVNNGSILISTPTSPGNQTYLTAAAPTTISGTGSIRLQATSSNGDNVTAFLNYNVPASTMTLGSGQTVLGYGRIYAGVINNGTINADIAAKGLFFIDQPKTNNATIEATNGGFIYVRGATINQSGTGVMTTVGASGFGLESGTISGGTIITTAAGPLGIVGSSTLDAITVTPGSVVQIDDNSILNLTTNGLVNNGSIIVDTLGAPGNQTRMLSGASTISGTGTVRLQATSFSNDTSYIQGTGDIAHPLTLGAGQTLTGTGRLYGNIVVNGTISPDQPFGTPTALGSIQPLQGSLKLGATSIFNSELASTASFDSMQGNSAVTISPGATLNVSLVGAYDPAVGSSYDIITGSSVTGTFSTVNVPVLNNKKQCLVIYGPTYVRVFVTCYANCDGSTGSPALTANDFQCFLNRFAANDPYANCDSSTVTPVLTANDFQCFLNKFAAGCT